MNLTRIHRLVKVISLLQNGASCDVEALANACDVSRRTIYRDIEALRLAGVPLVFDEPLGRYRILGAHYLPPTNFTPDEALAVILLCHELGDSPHLPFSKASLSAAVKLENALPARLRDYVRHLTAGVRIRLDSTSKRDDITPVYDRLLAAMAERRCVRIHYESFTEEECIGAKISPYRVLFQRRSWYVIGRSSVHREVRTFNLARIKKLEILEESYKIPQRFSLDRYLKNAWSLIPEPGPDHQIVIRFSPLVARNVEEVVWHKTQKTTWLENGELEFRATVSGLREISWWVMGYADQAEVLQPLALREMIVERTRTMLQRYGLGA